MLTPVAQLLAPCTHCPHTHAVGYMCAVARKVARARGFYPTSTYLSTVSLRAK